MSLVINNQTYYRTAEVCQTIGISRNTLYRWLQRGILGTTEHRDRRGWRLFTQDELDTLTVESNRITKINRFQSEVMPIVNEGGDCR